MIALKTGNLFNSECQTLVNATNTEGVMGGGIALAFQERFPLMFQEYVERCGEKRHTVAQPHLWSPRDSYTDAQTGKWVLGVTGPAVLNIATKDLIHQNSRLRHIAAGLSWTVENYRLAGITSIAFPALGCGLGGLDFSHVLPVMQGFLGLLDIPVEIYLPR